MTAVGDDDLLASLARLGAVALDLLDDVHALGHGAEDDVLPVQPRRVDSGQEELRAVGVLSGVGHLQRSTKEEERRLGIV